MMRSFSLFIIFFLIVISGYAQRISKVTMTGTGIIEMITIATDDAVINISPAGNIINYGIEYFSEKVSNYSRLENYTGRIDMFSAYDDKSFQGKLKYLGKTPVTYFASYDLESLKGKIRSIGSLSIGYYMQFEDEALRGKIKNIGNTQLSYFSSFENEALRGKLRSIGITNLSYYSSFDDKAFKGKIKNIGQVSFSWYSSFDTRYAGAMKTGSHYLNVNGVNYYLKL